MSTIIPPEGRDTLDPGPVPTTAEPAIGNTRGFCLGTYWTGNYPSVIQFHEDRLCLANAPQSPQRIDMSNSGLYEVFSPSYLLDGMVTDSNACAFGLSSNEVNEIRWLQSDQNGLQIGTAGGEWLMTPASSGGVLTPLNVNARQSSQNGSDPVAPVRVGVDTLFLQRGGRRLRQLVYDFYVNGFQGTDTSAHAEHLTAGGFKQIAFQATPQQLVWLVRNDGKLVSINYDRANDELGWSLHSLGGDGQVLSAEVIPAPDNSRDELWLAVKRTVNGSAVIYVERMSKLWEEGDATAYTVNGATKYRFTPSLTTYMDCALRTVFGSPVTTISGLDHLEGETVSVLADGATHPDCVVSGGAITLQRAALDVNVGLAYTSQARTMHLEGGAANGTAQGKKKRIHRVIFRLFDSLGLTVKASGSGGEQSITEPFRDAADLMDAPPALFNGDYAVDWEGTYETEGWVGFSQTEPLPLNVSAITVNLDVQDG